MIQHVCDRCKKIQSEFIRFTITVRPAYRNGDVNLEYCEDCFNELKAQIPQIEETMKEKERQREEFRKRRKEQTK